LIATTTLGGKSGWSPVSWSFFQTGEAFLEEPLPPLADDLAWCVEALCDLVVAHAVGREKDDLCADDITIR
jgi:hypothetical protein